MTAGDGPNVGGMCRNITPLRGLEPAATAEEIESAARQYVRKVGALSGGQMPSPAVERAVERVAAATRDLLAELPPRRRPPAVVPPLRRRVASSSAGGTAAGERPLTPSG